MPTPRKRLGKGLGALLGEEAVEASRSGSGVTEVSVSRIRPNRFQPRHTFEPEAIADLAASIAQKGVIQPLIVTSAPDGGWELVSGERRWRAAQQVGLATVPVIVRDVDERDLLEIALIENLQRRDLSPFEEAEGYRALGERHGYTQESIAKAVGKSRSLVAETLALLQIPERLRETAERLGIRSRSLLLEVAKLGDPAKMKALLERAGRQGLTRDDVRKDTREAARKAGAGGRRKPYVFKFKAPDQRYQLQLSFRQSTVDRTDLIHALEQILEELRNAKDE